jgi:hypothetical protein
MSIDWRLDMRLKSKQVLIQYMSYRGVGVRDLARMCDPRRPDRYRSAIGHLRSGARHYCNPALARLVEEHLQAPPGLLFDPQVSRVSRDNRTAEAA